MSRLCTSCGKELPDGVAFCTECGTPAPAEASPSIPQLQTVPQLQPQTAPAPARAATPPPTYTQSNNSEQSPKGRYGAVDTGYFFGMMFLYAIPVLGWLICIIMAFASRNENKKHFAKAIMIWLIIGIVLSVVGYFVFRLFGGMITDYINAELGGQFGDLQELLEQFKLFENGGLMPPIN